jgi:hypothetical protein
LGYASVEFLRSDEAEAAALTLDGKDVPNLGPSITVSLVNPAKSPDRGACTLKAPKKKGRDKEMTEDRPGGCKALRCLLFGRAFDWNCDWLFRPDFGSVVGHLDKWELGDPSYPLRGTWSSDR